MAKMNGFLKDDDDKDQVQTPAERITSKLVNVIKKKKKLKRLPNVTLWVEQIELLLNNKSESRVEKALEWFCRNLGKPNCPTTYSAKAFRKEFCSIEQASMLDLDPAADISDDAKKVLEWLKPLGWPKGSDVELPAAVQRTLDNYTPFLAKFKVALPKLAPIHEQVGLGEYPYRSEEERKKIRLVVRHYRILDYVKTTYLPAPRIFTDNWWNLFHGKVANWSNWSGSLAGYVFSEQSQHLLRLGRGWTYDYCNNSLLWDGAMLTLNEYGRS